MKSCVVCGDPTERTVDFDGKVVFTQKGDFTHRVAFYYYVGREFRAGDAVCLKHAIGTMKADAPPPRT